MSILALGAMLNNNNNASINMNQELFKATFEGFVKTWTLLTNSNYVHKNAWPTLS